MVNQPHASGERDPAFWQSFRVPQILMLGGMIRRQISKEMGKEFMLPYEYFVLHLCRVPSQA